MSVDDVQITVVDSTPPEILCTTDIAALWPPNHTMIPVTVYVAATDACTTPENMVLVGVTLTSDEPDDAVGLGDGSTTGDTDGGDGFSSAVAAAGPFVFDAGAGRFEGVVLLRAERAGNGGGRTYGIQAEVVDGSGNAAAAGCVVVVPRNRRSK